MARRKSAVPPIKFGDGEPPSELRWFTPGPGGWTGEDFAAFLRARASWRDTHVDPLPTLPARERHFMYLNKQGVPTALIEAENAAPNTLPPPYLQSAVVDRPAPPVFPTSEGLS